MCHGFQCDIYLILLHRDTSVFNKRFNNRFFAIVDINLLLTICRHRFKINRETMLYYLSVLKVKLQKILFYFQLYDTFSINKSLLKVFSTKISI